MARIHAVLDEDVDYGFEGGARYKTSVGDNPNRFEERDSEWKYGKHEYEASYGDINDERRDRIVSVFHICRGRRHSFLFKDHNDYQVTDHEIQGGEEGTTDTIQLYRVYEDFGQAFTVRPLQAFKNAVLKDDEGNEVAGTVDLFTGLFAPETEWGPGPYYLTGEYYVWVRFDSDYNPLTINSWRANTARVALVEDPIPFTATNVPNSWDGE